MSISVADVKYVASLARLRFREEEKQRLAQEMSAILDYMATLNRLDTNGIPPMTHVLDLHDVYRSDVVEQRISQDEALKNAPEADEAYFRVPKVIE